MILDLKAKLITLSTMILLGLGLSVGYHYYYGVIKGFPYPYTTFLFSPLARFTDFISVMRDSYTLNPYEGSKSAQYPFLIIMGYLFSLVLRHSYDIFFILVSGVFLLLGFIILKGQKWYTNVIPVLIISLLNYPFLFVMDRGNFEALVFIFVLIWLYFYINQHYLISAIFLALAISMKIYPAVLLVLFFSVRKYRELAVSLGCTVVITIFSLMFFKGGFLPNINFLLHGSNFSSNWQFSQFVSLGSNIVQRGASFLIFIKIFYFETGLLPGFVINHFFILYMIFASITGVLLVLYVNFLEPEPWKKITILIMAMLLLPPLSADYKLLLVFVPLLLFLNNKSHLKFDLIYLLLFGLLLIPKDYYFLTAVISDAKGMPHDISISVVINIFILIVISLMIIANGAKQRILKSHQPINAVLVTPSRNP